MFFTRRYIEISRPVNIIPFPINRKTPEDGEEDEYFYEDLPIMIDPKERKPEYFGLEYRARCKRRRHLDKVKQFEKYFGKTQQYQ